MKPELPNSLQQLKVLVRMNRSEIVFKKDSIQLKEAIGNVKELSELESHFPATEDNKLIIKSVSLLAEAYDQCGLYAAAVKTIKEWAEYYLEDPHLMKFENSEFEKKFTVTKQKLWVCLIYAQLLYRNEDYQRSNVFLIRCGEVVNFIQKKFKDTGMREFKLFGTQSRLAYQKALLFYELGFIEKGNEFSQLSLDFSIKRLETKRTEIDEKYPKEKFKIMMESEEVLARLSYAKYLVFCKAKQLRADGKLYECLETQKLGRICSQDLSQNDLQNLLLESEICTTKRLLSKNGFNNKRSITVFSEKVLHELNINKVEIQYKKKALIEKTMALIHRLYTLRSYKKKTHRDSEKVLTEVEESLEYLSVKSEGTSWQWRIFLLQSRFAIFQKNFSKAVKFADAAIKTVKPIDHKPGLIQAKLQKGRAFRSGNKYSEAIKTFQEILKLCRKNDLTFGLCQLSLAESYLLRGKKDDKPKDIQIGFEHWLNYKKAGTENGNVLAMADRLSNDFKDMEQSFFLPQWTLENSVDLNVKNNEKTLRKWLRQQAKIRLTKQNQPITEKNIAEVLGFSSASSAASLKDET